MLTGLLKFQNKDRYSDYMKEYITRAVEEVYESLWDRKEDEIPRIIEITEEVYEMVHQEIKLDLVYSAVGRKDYELFGYTKEYFMHLALRNEIEDEALMPDIDFSEFHMTVRDYLLENYYFFEDIYRQVRNVPVCEVW